MKLPILSALCAAALFWAVGMAYADAGKDESGKGRESDRYSSEKEWKDNKHRKEGKHGKDDGRGSYFHEHGHTRLGIPPDTILRRANAASGTRIALPVISLLQASAIRSLPERG